MTAIELTREPPLTPTRPRVDRLVDAGTAFAEIENLIVGMELSNDDRDALWVYAWSRYNVRRGFDLRGHQAHVVAAARPIRRPR